MANELARAGKTALPAVNFEQDVVAHFMRGRNANTMAAYEFDLSDFARSVGGESSGSAVELLLAAGHGGANAMVMTYKAELVERGLAVSTINLRLAGLRSMVRLGRQVGALLGPSTSRE